MQCKKVRVDTTSFCPVEHEKKIWMTHRKTEPNTSLWFFDRSQCIYIYIYTYIHACLHFSTNLHSFRCTSLQLLKGPFFRILVRCRIQPMHHRRWNQLQSNIYIYMYTTRARANKYEWHQKNKQGSAQEISKQRDNHIVVKDSIFFGERERYRCKNIKENIHTLHHLYIYIYIGKGMKLWLRPHLS